MEATDSQIFQDFIEHQVEVHRKDPELESKKLKARIESTPDYDERLREQAKQLPIDLIELIKSEQ